MRFFLENHLDFLDKKLNVNLSARLDDYSNFGTEINPSLGLYYKINEDLKLHGLISRSFRAPTFNDLYWPDEGWIKGNSSLKPEKCITTEAGIESSANKYIHCALNYFHNEYKQLIQWSDNGSGVWQPMNVSSAVINGIESKNNIYISDNLDLNVNYTFMIAKDDKTRKYLVYQPQNKVDASIRYHDPSGLIMELRGEFTGHRFNDAANNTKVKNFFVFSFNVSKRLRQGLTCFGSIDNLFDRRYQVIHDYPMPGFSITGGFKAEF